MKILLYYVGKPRDPHANRMAEEFIQRSTRYGRVRNARDRSGALRPLGEASQRRRKFCSIRPARRMDSPRFAKLVSQAEQEARDLVFLIGGASGLPPAWREKRRNRGLPAIAFRT